MTRTVEAVYEGGVLRPLQALEGIAEHTRVRVTVETPGSRGNGLSACIGLLPDEDAADLLRIIADEFEQVDVRDW